MMKHFLTLILFLFSSICYAGNNSNNGANVNNNNGPTFNGSGGGTVTTDNRNNLKNSNTNVGVNLSSNENKNLNNNEVNNTNLGVNLSSNKNNVHSANENSNSSNSNSRSNSRSSSKSNSDSSSKSNSKSTADNNNTINFEAQRNSASSANAPALHSAGVDICMGSSSGGVQGVTLGFSAGTTWTDKHCEALRAAIRLNELGFTKTAAARLCQIPEMAEAFAHSGEYECPKKKEETENETTTYEYYNPNSP